MKSFFPANNTLSWTCRPPRPSIPWFGTCPNTKTEVSFTLASSKESTSSTDPTWTQRLLVVRRQFLIRIPSSWACSLMTCTFVVVLFWVRSHLKALVLSKRFKKVFFSPDENWILTASHCMDGANSVEVIAGAHNIRQDEPTQQRMVSTEYTVHEGWTNNLVEGFDVTVIKLPQSLKFNG